MSNHHGHHVPDVFIMAAGRGTRLAPWTDALPKPLMPVANEPVLGHLLRLLARQGFRRVVVNASYQAGVMQQVIGNGDSWGVEVAWSVESEPMGTAGGMRYAAAQLDGDGPIVVLSGDGLHDADIAELVRVHEHSGAVATLGLIRVGDASLYGVAVLESDAEPAPGDVGPVRGLVRGFQEKPAPGTERSHLANCGIYVFDREVFELLRDDESDFGSELIPRLVSERHNVQGVVLDAYWNDIGDLDELRVSNFAALEQGFVAAHGGGSTGDDDPGAWGDGVLVHPSADVDPTAKLVAPCVIGANARIGAGAQLRRALVFPGGEVAAGTVVASGTVGTISGLSAWAHELG